MDCCCLIIGFLNEMVGSRIQFGRENIMLKSKKRRYAVEEYHVLVCLRAWICPRIVVLKRGASNAFEKYHAVVRSGPCFGPVNIVELN